MKKLIVVMILFGLVTGLHAQETIDYGDTVTGEIESGERADYTFEAAAGDLVSIRLTSDDFDSYVYLLDPTGFEIASNDDGAGNLNSLINGFAIPEDGTYTIQAASFGDDGAGSFELTLELQEVRRIEYGMRVEEDEALSGVYSFSGNEGDVIIATLAAESGFDTTIELIHPDGYTLFYGSYIDGQSSRVGPTALPQSGTYLLSARASDSYTLSLQRPEIMALTIGESVTGEFTEDIGTLYFSLDSDSTAILDLVIDSENTLDTKLEVISPYGYVITTVEDGRGTVDPSLPMFLANEVGTYYFVISPQNPNARLIGSITANISEAELPSLDDGPVTAELNFDNTQSISRFSTTAGQTVTVMVVINTAERYATPSIQLTQNDVELAYVTANGLKEYRFDVTMPGDGDVTVVMESYSRISATIDIDKSSE